MTDRDDLMACFQRFQGALLGNDIETLDDILAKDYRGFNLRGERESRGDILEAYQPGVTKMESWDASDVEVEVSPEMGVITGEGFVAGTYQGTPWSHRLRFCDVYVRRFGCWRLLISHAVELGED